MIGGTIVFGESSGQNLGKTATEETTERNPSVWIQATTGCPPQSVAFRLPSSREVQVMNVSESLHSRVDKNALESIRCNSSTITQSVQLIPKCPFWELQTYNANGEPKSVGGDEFYISYTDDVMQLFDHPTAVAQITDMQNGRYRLKFVSSPINNRLHRLTGHGTITVHFQYTCGIGMLHPSDKNDPFIWKDGGNTVVKYTQENVSVPPFVPFQPSQLPTSGIDLSQYPILIPLGDSLMQQFTKPLNVQPTNMRAALNNQTVYEWIEKTTTMSWLVEKFEMADKLHKQQQLDVNNTQSISKVGAILVGSHAWDLLATKGFKGGEGHAQGLQYLIEHLRKNYPYMDVMIKSPLAMHIHLPLSKDENEMAKLGRLLDPKLGEDPLERFKDRVRYMSESRARGWYDIQKQIATNLKVSFLDGYQASLLSADWLKKGDGRHYKDEFNTMVTNWFSTRTSSEMIWHRIHDGIFARKNESRRGSLVPFSCDTLTDLLNAILLAIVSNRQLHWERGSGQHNVCNVGSKFLSEQNGAVVDSNFLMLNHTDHVLEEQALSKYSSEHSQQSLEQLKRMYWDGPEFMHGLILSDVLKAPNKNVESATIERFRSAHSLESYNSVVLAVHEYLPPNKPRLTPCMEQLLQQAKGSTGTSNPLGLACNVLFASETNAVEWRVPLQALGCRAISLPGNHKDLYPLYPGLSTFLNNIDQIAALAHDGYILPGNKSSSEASLLLDMIHYVRSGQARRSGTLPAQSLPFCFWE